MIDNQLNTPIKLTEQKWEYNTIPKVSIFNWVYNQKEFIRESIEGILMQLTNFPVEIIIHDDASSDGTTEIIMEYETKFPKLFRNILHKENQWSQGISVMTPLSEKPRGKFIALLHGDDYWTDPLKLQKQVEFLEDNPAFVMSFHRIGFLIDRKINGSFYQKPVKNVLTAKDIILKHYIPTCSLVFKKTMLKNPFPSWLLKSRIGDIPLEIMLSANGLTYYHDEEMGCYRKNTSSVTHSKLQKKLGRKTYLFVYSNLMKELSIKHWPFLYAKIVLIRLGFVKDWLNLNRSLK